MVYRNKCSVICFLYCLSIKLFHSVITWILVCRYFQSISCFPSPGKFYLLIIPIPTTLTHYTKQTMHFTQNLQEKKNKHKVYNSL